mmetsp:Transcript_3714/g.8212  ORF Transcript_3714/g.8212 Transcript_3714/m.8212 type:complete len:251 (+) Transcript_3714:1656-2408(+)
MHPFAFSTTHFQRVYFILFSKQHLHSSTYTTRPQTASQPPRIHASIIWKPPSSNHIGMQHWFQLSHLNLVQPIRFARVRLRRPRGYRIPCKRRREESTGRVKAHLPWLQWRRGTIVKRVDNPIFIGRLPKILGPFSSILHPSSAIPRAAATHASLPRTHLHPPHPLPVHLPALQTNIQQRPRRQPLALRCQHSRRGERTGGSFGALDGGRFAFEDGHVAGGRRGDAMGDGEASEASSDDEDVAGDATVGC